MANGNGGPAGVGSAPSRRNGGAGRFNTGSLGSPWSRETYGETGADPGSADFEAGPRVGPGKYYGSKVTAEWGRNGGNGRNGR